MSPVLCPRAAIGLTLAAAACLPAQASEPQLAGLPLWEIGGFALGVSQQAYPGSDTQLNRALALPFVVYRGRWLRADQDTMGLRALKTDRMELDLGVAGSFGGGGDEIEARRGMSELGTLVELGPRLKLSLGEPVGRGRFRAEIPLRGVFDLNDRGRYRGVAFEPKLLYEGLGPAGWRYSTSLSVILADRRLSDYFYSVDPADATALRPVYAARGGLVTTRLSLSATRSLGPDWHVFGFARLDTVQGAANEDSPLVRKRGGASVGLGFSYTWQQSEARAHD